MTVRTTLLTLLIAATFAACAGKKPVLPADKLWTEGNDAYKDEAYEYAIQKYKALLDQYPFDPHAEEAELRIAQSYYSAERYSEAIAAFGNFERMHPTSPNLAETEYYRGLAYEVQATTADRDQQPVTNALNTFRTIVDRFPGTPWADRAELRIRECREALARHEAEVALYYLTRKSMRAAESRLHGLLTEYAETDATAGALSAFANAYTVRDDSEAATLAWATIVRHHPDGPLADNARDRLGPDVAKATATDPLPQMIAFLDSARTRPDRTSVPKTVSAYDDRGNASGQRY